MKYTAEMVSYGVIYVKSFMESGTGVQTILRFRRSNFRECNIGIADEWNL
jgi:hypothetical protein